MRRVQHLLCRIILSKDCVRFHFWMNQIIFEQLLSFRRIVQPIHYNESDKVISQLKVDCWLWRFHKVSHVLISDINTKHTKHFIRSNLINKN